MNFGELLEIPPFSLNKEQKNELLTRRLKELTHLHQSNCPEYRKILDSLNFDIDSVTSYSARGDREDDDIFRDDRTNAV